MKRLFSPALCAGLVLGLWPRAAFAELHLAAPASIPIAEPLAIPQPPFLAGPLSAAQSLDLTVEQVAAAQGDAPAQNPLAALPALDHAFTGSAEPAKDQTFALDDRAVNDLGLFEPQSGLFDLINRSKTTFGANRLRELIKNPYVEKNAILRRQDAIKELMSDAALRGKIQSAFNSLGPQGVDSTGRDFLFPRTTTFDFVMANLMTAVPLSLAIASIPHAFWAAPSFHAVASKFGALLFIAMFISPVSRPIAEIRAALLRYKAMFQLALGLTDTLASARSPALREIGGAFRAVKDPSHPESVAQLGASLRRVKSGPLVAILDLLYGHSAKTLWRLTSGFKSSYARVARVLDAMGELDVFLGLAENALANPKWAAFPAIKDGPETVLRIDQGHHPLLASKDSSTPNDVHLRSTPSPEAGNFQVVTGANMGGKSTYLRMAGLLTVLAQMGSPVPAAAMELTPLRLVTNIDIRDSLSKGKSLFDAETDNILAIIRQAARPERLLVIMDEILQGTDPEDRTAIEQAVARHLAQSGKLFVVATHNRSIIPLAEQVPGIVNVHVEEKIENDKMSFTHKVLPGPATSRNAVPTLAEKGFPKDVVDEAAAILKKSLTGR